MDGYLAVVQAHMSSKRLPGKVMMELGSKPIIWHVTERLKLSQRISRIVVAVSIRNSDDILCDYLKETGREYIRGSEEDVLGRFYSASERFPSRAVVRVTSDNPLIDPYVLDETISFFESKAFDYVRTEGFPVGIGAEVFTPALLKKAFICAHTPHEREHVTPFMDAGGENPGVFRCGEELGHIRLTVDTKEDFVLMEQLYARLFRGKHDFFLDDILRMFGFMRGNEYGGTV